MSGGAIVSGSVALVTCAELPNGHVDDRSVVDPLARLGVAATFAVWDDPSVDWTAFDLVILRSTWDYPSRREEFVGWASGISNLLNPIEVVRWSSDKRYLRDLTAGGAPCIPTTYLEPGAPDGDVATAIRTVAASARRFVVKPSVGAGSVDAGRFESDERSAVDQAIKHAAWLVDNGRTALVQPYLDAIDEAGETAIIFLDGRFSHAIRKEPLLNDGPAEVEGLFQEERTSPTTPTDAEMVAADLVLDAMPFGRADLLYARVDLLPGADGRPLLLELELVEPSLFIDAITGSARGFATAIANRLP